MMSVLLLLLTACGVEVIVDVVNIGSATVDGVGVVHDGVAVGGGGGGGLMLVWLVASVVRLVDIGVLVCC